MVMWIFFGEVGKVACRITMVGPQPHHCDPARNLTNFARKHRHYQFPPGGKLWLPAENCGLGGKTVVAGGQTVVGRRIIVPRLKTLWFF